MVRLTNGYNAVREVESQTQAEYLLRHGWMLEEQKPEEKPADKPRPASRKKVVVGDKPEDDAVIVTE